MSGSGRWKGYAVAAALLAGVAAGAAVVVAAVAPRGLEPLVLDQVERATGRRPVVAGPFRVTLLPIPAIEADDVSLSNPPGFPDPVMARVHRLRASIDPIGLLGGRVWITSLSLDRPSVRLERRADGLANWVFERRRAPARAGAPAGEGRRVSFGIGEIDATGGDLSWRDLDPRASPRLGSGGFSIDHLHARRPDDHSSVTLSLHGRHDGHPFDLSASSGSPALLARADAAAPFPARATLVFGPDGVDTVSVRGEAVDPLHGRGVAGHVTLHLDTPRALLALFPHADPPAGGPVDAEADLATDSDGRPQFGRFRLALASLDLGFVRPGLALDRLDAHADAAAAPIAVAADGSDRGRPFALRAARFATPDFWSRRAGVAPLDAVADWGGAHVALSGALGRDAAGGGWSARADTLSVRGLGLAPLRAAGIAVPGPARDPGPIDAAGALDANGDGRAWTLAFAATALSTGGVAWPAATWRVRRNADGGIDAGASDPADPRLLAVSIRPAATGSLLRATADAHGLPAGPILRLAAGLGGLRGALALRADLSASRTGGRIALASLAGPVDAVLTGATLDGALAHALIAPLAGGTGLLPGRLGPQPVHCADLAGRFDAGALSVSHLSLDTPFLTLDGAGTVDLASDRLSLALTPRLRLGPATASTAVSVSGSTEDPRVSLARGPGDRFDLALGRGGAARPAACDLVPGVGAPPQRKAPRVLDLLRGLGIGIR